MKKLIIILIVLGALFLTYNTLFPKTEISAQYAYLTYICSDEYIVTQLSYEESNLLKDIFNNKRQYPSLSSCGFSLKISIRFEDLVFCIARDNCAFIKIDDRYIWISETDREVINKIFERYGGTFPCD